MVKSYLLFYSRSSSQTLDAVLVTQKHASVKVSHFSR